MFTVVHSILRFIVSIQSRGDKLGVMGGIIGKLKAKKFMTYSHENMILICPPLIITPEQLREEMVKVDEVLTEVDATL